jgi:NAD(P)-dependent dehydrogenase (short-subunit alcohol dehydrogenase family)
MGDNFMVGPTRSILMTGASRGLGMYAAQHLLRTYPDVHLVVSSRDQEPGSLARTLAGDLGGGRITELQADLADLRSVRDLAENVAALAEDGSIPPLHGVLANAGAQYMSTTHQTVDGYEATFAVNVLANVLLTEILVSRLALPGRIVITSSDTHFGDFRHNMAMVPGPAWREPHLLAKPGVGPKAKTARAGQVAYSTSKLAVIYYVHALARALPAGVEVYAYNPGLVPGTGLARDRDVLSRMAWRSIMPVMALTPLAHRPRRAGRLLAEAMAGASPGVSGDYLDRGRPARSSEASYDEALEGQLFEAARSFCA